MTSEKGLQRPGKGVREVCSSTGHPEPPLWNTKEGLSTHALLPPVEVVEEEVRGWSSACVESERKKRGGVPGEGGRVRGETSAKERDGVVRDEPKSGSDVGGGLASSPARGAGRLTRRDVAVLAWIGRHGVVSVDQVGRRFWQKPEASRATRRRMTVLLEAGLLARWAPLWTRGPALLIATSRGLRVASVPLRQARVVSWRTEHSLALVDLSEELLAEYAGSSWLTERELMVGGWRTSLNLRRLPDGLLVQSDGRRFAVELEASRKEAERLRRIVNDYLPALAGPNALAGVIWYARRELSAGIEHLRSAVNSHGLGWAFEVRTWEGRP
jgi:hypothetical protein